MRSIFQPLLRPVGVLAAAAMALVMQSPAAHATLIFTGGTEVAVAEPDPGAGTVLATTSTPVVAATFTGTLKSSAITGDPTNPLGGLTFTYQLTNDATSSHSIGRFTVSGFTGFGTDVSYQEPPLAGTAPTIVDRDPVSGDVVGYTFLSLPFGFGQLAAGSASAVLVIQTDAAAFAKQSASVIDGSVADVTVLGPFGQVTVPEPSGLLLSLGAAATLLMVRSGRRRLGLA